MPKEPEELTDDEIKEAIEKKRCPYCKCKSRKFIGDFPAWQKFDFDQCDLEGKPLYHDPDTSASFERVECNECGEEIPEIIWREWEL